MQTALKIMPLFFAFISFNFITGLVLYFATSNVFRIGQQALIISLDDREEGTPDSQEVIDTDASEVKKGGPNPNASKKRGKRRRK